MWVCTKTMTPNTLSPRSRKFILTVDRFVFFLSRHWLSLVILFLAIFSGLPFLAPVLAHYGFDAPAGWIYMLYSLTCHQLAYRSFFFFGSANAYPVDQLQSALHATEPAGNVLFWREFLGNPDLGYKMAWCERDTSMYVSMLLGLILFGFVRSRLHPLDPRLYILCLVPMAIDGVWQLFTSPLVLAPFLPVHESTPELRILTGVLFGIATVWLIFPHVDIAMRETLARAQRQYELGMTKEKQTT